MLARLDDSLLDGGLHKGAARERMCVVTRETRPIAELIRFVVGPDGQVVPDVKRNLPGRGLWISATREAVDQAIKRKLFTKGFKRDVRSGPELGDLTDRLLERSALDALAIAGKAGEVVTGFTKVEAAVERGGLLALLHASDGSPEGGRKAAALLHRNPEDDSPEIPVIRAFSGAQLDLALGRSNVVHAALLAGRASDTFLARWRDLERFRCTESDADRRSEIAGSPAAVTEQLGMG